TPVKGTPTVKWILCPKGCGKWLSSKKVNRHLNKAHPIDSGASGETATINPVRPSSLRWERKYEACSVCKATVRVERIERHMMKAHKRRLLRPATANVQDTAPTTHPLAATTP